MCPRNAAEGVIVAKGGARIRSGPAPDPSALVHGDMRDWTRLSSAPVTDAPPVWPLPEQSEREDVLWAIMWGKPQSRIWRTNGQELEVALHVRTFGEAERTDAPTSLRTLVRQQQDSLLLSLPALRGAKILIVDAAPVAAPVTSTANRGRLELLRGDGA